MRIHSKRAGYSLIELLVVIAILGVLMGLIIPAVQSVRAAANRTHCANNLASIGKAYHSFVDAHGMNTSTFKAYDPSTNKYWPELLAKYLENNQSAILCVNDETGGTLSYGASKQAQYFKVTTDSNKVLITEYVEAVIDVFGTNRDNWLGNPNVNPVKFPMCAPRHQGMLNVLFRGGHVQAMLPAEIAPFNWEDPSNSIYNDNYKNYWRPTEPGPGT